MKRCIVLLLAIGIVISMTGCGVFGEFLINNEDNVTKGADTLGALFGGFHHAIGTLMQITAFVFKGATSIAKGLKK